MRVLHWFRADLRVNDNTALRRASEAATRGVVGLYVVSPGDWKRHDVAPVRIEFALRSLTELSAALGALGIPLLIRVAEKPDDVPRVVAEVCRQFECDAVYFNREYEVNERRRDSAVEAALGVRMLGFTDQVLIDPSSIRTGGGTFYTVFTPFKKAFLGRSKEMPAVLPSPRKQASLNIEPSPVPAKIKDFEASVDPSHGPAGEAAAMARLRSFVAEGINDYKKQRDFPGVQGTSGLSSHLAAGTISPRQCFAAAVEANGGRWSGGRIGPECWISELIWREFFVHILVGFPRVCMNRAFKPATERIAWRDDDDGFEAWKAGRTGYPIVDAAMRQLAATGWMHNRCRMVAAMFLAKDLLIDWRRGEAYFMRSLVDGFFASNNGGWQWSAGTGADAAPYFRIFNPESQSLKFDADGAYIRRWVPELASVRGDEVHNPSALTRARTGYPGAIVDHGRARERVLRAFEAVRA